MSSHDIGVRSVGAPANTAAQSWSPGFAAFGKLRPAEGSSGWSAMEEAWFESTSAAEYRPAGSSRGLGLGLGIAFAALCAVTLAACILHGRTNQSVAADGDPQAVVDRP